MATILMMDDDTDLVSSMRIVIEAQGHTFHAAPDGERGLQLLREVNPDLIILDLMMNRYTEGFRVSQVIRDPAETSPFARFRHVPIVVFTSIHKTTPYRFGRDEASLPVDAFLEKSVPIERLLQTITDLLARSAASRDGSAAVPAP